MFFDSLPAVLGFARLSRYVLGAVIDATTTRIRSDQCRMSGLAWAVSRVTAMGTSVPKWDL